MKRIEIIKRLTASGVIAVVRANSKDEAVQVIDAIVAGGINAIEITYTIKNATEVISEVAANYDGTDVLIGAGTVLDAETARSAILAGAQFIVGPNFNREVAKLCNRYQIPYTPGCMTINEMIEALEWGCDIVKLFPGGAFGPKMIKDVKGPLPHINIMPTGGVSLDNAEEWIKNGAVAIGVGSDLTKHAKTKEFDKVTLQAKKYVEVVKKARGK
ncbi:MAG: bifunctional 4-hydroxy-2-oxoglutarate aldolase/2-dehydro-3-deoxy-phosphogluconate aldolase [Acholeplasmataceae bacterium]|jgi:2-dehydro-3-deoxyphosphogluconate aldolase/(4S)-4-hydroxy-2-oxoglutarate aldolase